MSESEQERSHWFAKWLLSIGSGELGEREEDDDGDTSWISIPPEYCEKAIVCPKNDTVDLINARHLLSVEGRRKIYLSNDEAIPLGGDTSETELLYPMEYLNTMNFLGFPPHELELKVGSPIMLLGNVNLSEGLCNGTRMIVKSLKSKVIKAQIITCTRVGDKTPGKIQRNPATASSKIPIRGPRNGENKKSGDPAHTLASKPNQL
ncbi:DNA helicase [Tanacetum coccineum]|uniref:DNA helicase n=1 Tax=Tanacetum coccineum TaxID=301880 RepID=A0ABQ5A4I4_9ASTR